MEKTSLVKASLTVGHYFDDVRLPCLPTLLENFKGFYSTEAETSIYTALYGFIAPLPPIHVYW